MPNLHRRIQESLFLLDARFSSGEFRCRSPLRELFRWTWFCNYNSDLRSGIENTTEIYKKCIIGFNISEIPFEKGAALSPYLEKALKLI